jgi:hypothetical protein
MEKCAQKRFDRADIVRDVRLRRFQALASTVVISPIVSSYPKHPAFVPNYFFSRPRVFFDRANWSMSFNAPSLASL